MSTFFDELLESVQQMDEIVKGERAPSRERDNDTKVLKVSHSMAGESRKTKRPDASGSLTKHLSHYTGLAVATAG